MRELLLLSSTHFSHSFFVSRQRSKTTTKIASHKNIVGVVVSFVCAVLVGPAVVLVLEEGRNGNGSRLDTALPRLSR